MFNKLKFAKQKARKQKRILEIPINVLNSVCLYFRTAMCKIQKILLFKVSIQNLIHIIITSKSQLHTHIKHMYFPHTHPLIIIINKNNKNKVVETSVVNNIQQ